VVLRVFLRFGVVVCVLVGVGVLAGSAWGARGHVFSGVFGSAGSGAGEFSGPAGVGVDEVSGDVYVADKGDDRVEQFTSSGVFVGEFTGPEATGTGTLTEGSSTVEEAVTLTGAFVVGEEVSGEGVPAGTVITGVPGGGVLELSNVVEAGKSGMGVLLVAQQRFAGPEEVAVDNSTEADPSAGDVYVVDSGHGVVDKFTAGGVFVAQIAGLESIDGVGVDAHGEVWVGTQEGAVGFSDEEVPAQNNGIGASLAGGFDQPGFAVDGEDDFYLNSAKTGAIFKVGPSGCSGLGGECGGNGHLHEPGLLDESFDPVGSVWLGAEAGSDDVYVEHGSSLVRRSPGGSVIETLGAEAGLGALSAGAGVAVDAASGLIFVAEAGVGDVVVYKLEPAGVPRVASEEVSAVTAESAQLEGSVIPRSEPGEASASYKFEYGPCASVSACASSGYPESVPVPEGSAGTGFEVVALAAENVQHLTAGTVYHYRVVVSNEVGHTLNTVDGEEQTFTTQSAGGFVLPDDRQWQQVSPVDKHGAPIASLNGGVPVQAAAGGGAMAFATDLPTEPSPAGYAGNVEVLAVRGAGGWSSRDLTIAHLSTSKVSVGTGAEYRLFSPDLSQVLVQPQGPLIACRNGEGAEQPCLSGQATEQTPFLESDFSAGDPEDGCVQPSGGSLAEGASGCFEPLVTSVDDTASPFEPFGEEGICAPPDPKQPFCGPKFLDASADLQHVVLQSSVPLSSPTGGELYEWSAGKPADEAIAPIGLLPADEGGGPASHVLLGDNGEETRNAVSADGDRVFWTAGANDVGGVAVGALYVRDVARGESLLVAPAGAFEDASTDGSRVFYEEAGSLYECAIGVAGGHLACSTRDLGSGVLGAVSGVSEDGSWVYFVSESVLAAGGVSGSPNLYVEHEGTAALVAVLSSADYPDWAGADGQSLDLSTLVTRSSGDGRWFSFVSDRGLTGYDSRDAVTGLPDEEVYLYHAPEGLGSGRGELSCASCDPSGARPVGEEGKRVSEDERIVGGEAWETFTGGVAALTPGWDSYRLKKALYQPRFLGDSGRLFFDGRDGLVPAASGGSWDVYEFEPEGVGPASARCREGVGGGSSSEAFETAREVVVEGRGVLVGAGCVGLVSGGASGEESEFLDASESGGDVFFQTSARLVPGDTDSAYDVYDAHECSSEAPCLPESVVAAPVCVTEASCRPAPSPQPGVYGAPGSETFQGPGNLTPVPKIAKPAATRAEKLAAALRVCRRKHVGRKRVACERLARKRYAKPAKKAKRSSVVRRRGGAR
jgi:phosphohistidine swiveling domain-containing protein